VLQANHLLNLPRLFIHPINLSQIKVLVENGSMFLAKVGAQLYADV